MARTNLALTLLLCSSLFIGAVVAAEEAVTAQETDAAVNSVEDDMEKEAKDEMDRMDTNKDGKVNLDEVQAYFRKEFYSPEDMKDSTEGKDGKAPTDAEITELVKNDATEFITELDKDKDGSLDLTELKEQYKTDGDGDEDEDMADGDEGDGDEDEDMGEMDADDQDSE
eukprot:TRINITY_DN1727_c0_g1_i1.p1 TRINITY_DN1727_c0_g1~~TRINITY_DN1727_c0_g1_i1.p1  ORF type:complete len:169 (+),score=75.15 TRINITY_DN1727_c0_g1_i1:229-735(+)